MKPGTRTLRFVKTKINLDDCDDIPVDHLAAYFKKVLESHEGCLAKGVDPDMQLEQIRRNLDPTAGSAEWLS